MARCLTEFHCRYGPRYDGRLEVVDQGDGYRRERCRVCGTEYMTTLAEPQTYVKSEIEDWQDQAIERHHARVQA